MLRNLLRWARITKAGSDTEQFATQQMEYLGKVADGLIVFPYGMHANATPDSLALMFAVQGNADNRAAIAWTPKDRPTLKAGEVAIYHPETDAFIIWRETGDLDIETGDGGSANINIKCNKVTVDCDSAEVNATTESVINTAVAEVNATTSLDVTSPISNFSGIVNISGALNALAGMAITGAATANGKDISDTHTHPAGTPPGNTGAVN